QQGAFAGQLQELLGPPLPALGPEPCAAAARHDQCMEHEPPSQQCPLLRLVYRKIANGGCLQYKRAPPCPSKFSPSDTRLIPSTARAGSASKCIVSFTCLRCVLTQYTFPDRARRVARRAHDRHPRSHHHVSAA